MDFFSKISAFASGGSDSSSADKTDAGDSHEHQQLDPTELFSSAKVVANAVKSAFGDAADQVDKSTAAGAASDLIGATSDLLGAVSHYMNIEESSYGKYMEQAETYLDRTTGGSAAVATPKTEEAAEAAAKDEEAGANAASKTGEEGEKAEEAAAEKAPLADDDSGEAQSRGGGLGGYLNLAQNFLNK